VEKGFHWDEAILYPPHTHWNDGPTPLFWNGPVYKIASALEKALNEQAVLGSGREAAPKKPSRWWLASESLRLGGQESTSHSAGQNQRATWAVQSFDGFGTSNRQVVF
jgi:hypothetical protein